MMDFISALSKSIKEQHTEESLRRANICAACPEKEKRFYAEFVNAEIKDIEGFVCTRCSCPLGTKVFASEPKNICDKWLQK
jgi:hypothetical protein